MVGDLRTRHAVRRRSCCPTAAPASSCGRRARRRSRWSWRVRGAALPMTQLEDGFFAVTTEAPGRQPLPLRARGRHPRAGSGLAPSARGRPRPERGDRPQGLCAGSSRLARPAVARDGALRAPRRRLQRAGHVRRSAAQARPPGAARHHRARVDARRRLLRHAQLGLRRRRCRSRPMPPMAGPRTSSA